MSAVNWTGPYTHAETASGEKLLWEPLAAGSTPPSHAARFIVRWRVSTLNNARKKTFTSETAGAAWAKQIAAAKLLGTAADERGWPHASPGAGQLSEAASQDGTPGPIEADTGRAIGQTPPAAATWQPAGTIDLPGASIEEFIDHLIEQHQPRWEQQRQARWWIDHLRTLAACFTYDDGDPRIGHYGIKPGDSKHFLLLDRDFSDFAAALQMRRSTDLRARNINVERKKKFDRDRAAYEEKLAKWNARKGHKGRKPVAPTPPEPETEYSDTQVLISATTESHFRTHLSFVFDRAFDVACAGKWRGSVGDMWRPVN